MTTTLTFYNRRQRSIRVVPGDDCLCFARKWELPLLDTENEYLITLRHITDEMRFSKVQCSFIEVVHDGRFIARHYVRDFILSPLVSYDPDRSKDELMRAKQIATVPTLDWRAIQRDAMWAPAPRWIDIKSYKQKP